MIKQNVRLSRVLGLMAGLTLLAGRGSAAVKIHLDFVNFMKDGSHSETILYYQITSDRTKPTQKFDWILGMKLNIQKADTAWLSRDWELQVPIDLDAARETGLKYVGRIAFETEANIYQADLTVTDKTFDNENDGTQVQFVVQSQSNPRPMFSDILLASSIQNETPEQAQNPFVRNGLLVMPRPDGAYSAFDSELFYYVETYHLLQQTAPQDYLFQSVITRTDGSVVKRSKIKKYPKDLIQDAMATFEQITLAGIDSGSYQLQIALYDSSRREIAHQSKPFSITMPPQAVPDTTIQFLNQINPFASMRQDEFDEELKSLKYILNSQEQLILKSLKDETARRQFVCNYWLSKDAARSNPRNVYYLSHKERVQTANVNFKAFANSGWKTDRGRIYIQFGQPDNIDRYHNSLEKIPYEIWHYDNIESGVQFVFADIDGDSNYTLIHSTKIGEVYNPNYESLLQRVRGDGDSDSESDMP